MFSCSLLWYSLEASHLNNDQTWPPNLCTYRHYMLWSPGCCSHLQVMVTQASLGRAKCRFSFYCIVVQLIWTRKTGIKCRLITWICCCIYNNINTKWKDAWRSTWLRRLQLLSTFKIQGRLWGGGEWKKILRSLQMLFNRQADFSSKGRDSSAKSPAPTPQAPTSMTE